ncbi:hypothetical protein [Flavobacterium humi]|uniref:Uncharacterized protein n=1 Tax=Flavobacterium humi TaxID=2562683 RepID=A0A4Z0L2W3_9FLAO|nr:hypothetical protein [Flavobacterium humi]TGD56664.1 hypothetical protein E4635_14555 [Flavobacterium humi]
MENRKYANTGEGNRADRRREEGSDFSGPEQDNDQDLIPLPYGNTDESSVNKRHEDDFERKEDNNYLTSNDNSEKENENKEDKPERQPSANDSQRDIPKDNGDDGIPEDDRPAHPGNCDL